MSTAIKRDLARLDEKRVLAYFKKPVGESVSVVRTEHDYLLTDKIAVVRLPNYINIGPFGFPADWKSAIWTSAKAAPVEAGSETAVAVLEKLWNQWEASDVWFQPELTRELLEVPVAGHHNPGLLYRKFTADGHGPWYYDKRMLDLFSPDVVDLEDFQFELLDRICPDGLMRVSARYGHVAYLMPVRFK